MAGIILLLVGPWRKPEYDLVPLVEKYFSAVQQMLDPSVPGPETHTDLNERDLYT